MLNDKSVLPALCRRKLTSFNGNFNPHTLNCHPLFLPATFDLTSDLIKFVSYFLKRQQKNLDNYWIIKPTNLTGSAGIFITNNLNAIIRMRSSQNRVASLYVSNPLLFHRADIRKQVKFELKYFVVLTSVLPLKLFVYRAFQVDLANKPFSLEPAHLYDQQMHLTDMSIFSDDVKRLDINHIEFINHFNYQYQYSQFNFDQLDAQTMRAIRELFELSTEKFPFSAINHNTASSALYQVDVLLSWTNQHYKALPPVRSNIIEVNLNPDCKFIAEKFPNFYNELFELMFLDEENCNFRAI